MPASTRMQARFVRTRYAEPVTSPPEAPTSLIFMGMVSTANDQIGNRVARIELCLDRLQVFPQRRRHTADHHLYGLFRRIDDPSEANFLGIEHSLLDHEQQK